MTTLTGPSPEAASLKALRKDTSRPRDLFNIIMTGVSGLCLGITLVPLFLVLAFVLVRGIGRVNFALLTQLPPASGSAGGGVGNAIVGTIVVVVIATAIAVPFGVMAAVYLAEFSEGSQLARWVRFFTNVLSGVPSIISGVFIYALLVKSRLTGFSAVAGGVSLAVLMLPTIIRTTDEALQIIPKEIRWASVGVGSSRYQTVLQIVLPAAIPSILTGVTLAISRAAGETAPLIFTALSSNFWPDISIDGLFDPIASLSVIVYNFARSPFDPQQELAWAASLILVLLVLLTSVASRLATSRKTF
ncbi:MAG: phosphate ABC transporter permease PstA [Cyanobacteria bacterium J06636_28]